jgi:hypothetical protein
MYTLMVYSSREDYELIKNPGEFDILHQFLREP